MQSTQPIVPQVSYYTPVNQSSIYIKGQLILCSINHFCFSSKGSTFDTYLFKQIQEIFMKRKKKNLILARVALSVYISDGIYGVP